MMAMAGKAELNKKRQGFFIKKSPDEACLLLHGLSGTPVELFPLAQYLASVGYSVEVPLLAGHGSSLEELRAAKAQTWIEQTQREYIKLKKTYKKVYVVGTSLGALLALRLGEVFEPDALVLLNHPLYLKGRGVFFAHLLGPFISCAPVDSIVLPEGNERYLLGYQSRVPLSSIRQNWKIARHARGSLWKVRCPFLAIYAQNDSLVARRSLAFLLKKASSETKETLIVEKGGHFLTLDASAEKVNKAIGKFLSERIEQ
jgi:carboxylesterase